MEPSANVIVSVLESNDVICDLFSISGCEKGTVPKRGEGFRRDEMMGSFETSRMSCRASKAETEPPTTMTLCMYHQIESNKYCLHRKAE